MIAKPDHTFFKFLRSSSGSIDMNAAGSSSVTVNFSVTPDTSKGPVSVNRINISMTGPEFFSHDFFGGSSALTNGIKVEALSSSGAVLADFLDGQTITENHEWTWLAGADVVNAPATSAMTLYAKAVRWTFAKSGAELHLGIGSRLQMTVQDDLSSSGRFTEFNAMVQGVYQ